MAEIATSTATYEIIEPHLFRCKMIAGSHVDLPEVDENLKVTLALANEERYAVLVDARVITTITAEAMQYAQRPETYRLLIAQAIVVDSLPNRLIANFIIKFHKPTSPTKLFSNEEAALIWLRNHMRKDKEKQLEKNKGNKLFF
jgi:hypothetical protein